jgi:microcystin-dependent protein
MEAGTETALRQVSPLRVKQAITALAVSAPTGSVFDYVGSTAPTGYVLLSGRTIGNASSGGTERANADTQTLFELLWNSMTNTEAPVSGGRGASASADFAANKTITLPDARGRVIAGKDNMGGTTASRMTSGGSGITGTTLGTSGGTETHTLTIAQLASHNHAENVGQLSQAAYKGQGWDTGIQLTGDASVASGRLTTDSSGSGSAHQNTQPTLVLNKIIKL